MPIETPQATAGLSAAEVRRERRVRQRVARASTTASISVAFAIGLPRTNRRRSSTVSMRDVAGAPGAPVRARRAAGSRRPRSTPPRTRGSRRRRRTRPSLPPSSVRTRASTHSLPVEVPNDTRNGRTSGSSTRYSSISRIRLTGPPRSRRVWRRRRPTGRDRRRRRRMPGVETRARAPPATASRHAAPSSGSATRRSWYSRGHLDRAPRWSGVTSATAGCGASPGERDHQVDRIGRTTTCGPGSRRRFQATVTRSLRSPWLIASLMSP